MIKSPLDYPSWKEFQRLANMTQPEAQAADVLMSAAVAEYRTTRSGAVTIPLAGLAPTNPSDLGGLSPERWVVQFLRKVWVVSVSQGSGQLTFSLCLSGAWQIDSDAQEVYVRCAPLAMKLFCDEAPAV